MMKVVHFLTSFFMLLLLMSCFKEDVIYDSDVNRDLEPTLILRLNGKDCSYDHEANLLRYSISENYLVGFSPYIEFQNYSTVYFDNIELTNNSINNLGDIEFNRSYNITIKTKEKSRNLNLTFTNLPIVQIITANTIYDEPQTLGKIIVKSNDINSPASKYFIGIEYRGNTSQSYSKKSYGISLKSTLNLDDDISRSFLGMKEENNWILDAMYIDNARLRNKTSFEVWNKIVGDETSGIASEFVELFVNNEHRGLYCLNENLNAEFLKINNSNAVLYKAIDWENGATKFEYYTDEVPFNYYWDGWEQKYPNPSEVIHWDPLQELRYLIVEGTDNEFVSNIFSEVDMDNIIDYYILLNLTSANDNVGKNTFLFRENKDDLFVILPWDLDGSWGILWDGTHINSNGVLSNNLFDRLMSLNADSFKSKLKNRWNILRAQSLSNTALITLFDNHFTTLKTSDVVDIENQVWGLNIAVDAEKVYLTNWLENRIIFLDNYFDGL